ncbi:hypothetical protein BH20ACI3_BH20ACI3_27240 [soil metagenome]
MEADPSDCVELGIPTPRGARGKRKSTSRVKGRRAAEIRRLMAIVHAGLGEKGQAFIWLDQPLELKEG